MEENRKSKCCGNCAYQMEKSNFYGGATCTNNDSAYYLQWVKAEHKCEKHRWKEDGGTA